SGEAAAEYARALGTERPEVVDEHVEGIAKWALTPFERPDGENPFEIHEELREVMQNNVGLVRNEGDMKKAIEEIQERQERSDRVGVHGIRVYNPGWHTALDLRPLLTVA